MPTRTVPRALFAALTAAAMLVSLTSQVAHATPAPHTLTPADAPQGNTPGSFNNPIPMAPTSVATIDGVKHYTYTMPASTVANKTDAAGSIVPERICVAWTPPITQQFLVGVVGEPYYRTGRYVRAWQHLTCSFGTWTQVHVQLQHGSPNVISPIFVDDTDSYRSQEYDPPPFDLPSTEYLSGFHFCTSTTNTWLYRSAGWARVFNATGNDAVWTTLTNTSANPDWDFSANVAFHC